MIQPYIPDATKPFSYRLAGHLLRRTMVGPTHEEIIAAEKKGLMPVLNIELYCDAPQRTKN